VTFTTRFFVAGTPKGQPRPRAFVRNMGGKMVARVFDAGTAEGWKSAVATAGEPHRPANPLTGPVVVALDFRMPRPRGHYGSGKNAANLKASAPTYHTGKPDVDNLAKAVLDALTHCSWWRDDAQVVALTVKRWWCRAGKQAGCAVYVSELGEDFET
jgi:Holliday junction resolvase RusA-like endonuclease